MRSWLIRTIGLRGSWRWACKKLDHGYMVRPGSATGAVRYRLDLEKQRRIQWAFKRTPTEGDWTNAYIFMHDFERTDWVLA